MVGKEKSVLLSISVTSGTGTGTIPREWSLSRRFRVVPPSEAAVFTVTIKDLAGDKVWARSAWTGFLSEQQFFSLGIADTVVITSASEDGTYKVKFDLH